MYETKRQLKAFQRVFFLFSSQHSSTLFNSFCIKTLCSNKNRREKPHWFPVFVHSLSPSLSLILILLPTLEKKSTPICIHSMSNFVSLKAFSFIFFSLLNSQYSFFLLFLVFFSKSTFVLWKALLDCHHSLHHCFIPFSLQRIRLFLSLSPLFFSRISEHSKNLRKAILNKITLENHTANSEN